MRGALVPVVLVPRYTSLVGSGTWTTIPLNVEEYCKGTITLWRGRMPGSGPPTFTAYFEDSHDGVDWTPFDAGGEDPGADASDIVRFDLVRRWLRVRIVLTGTNTGVSCWAAGLFEKRVEGA
jgi:hypothetical protein